MKPQTKLIIMISLAALVVFGYFAYLVILAYIPIPSENKDLVSNGSGVLLSAFTLVLGYYFGSSQGSSDKNELMKK